MFYSQQHPSSPVRSTGRSPCPPPPCTRAGSARQQAPRMGALRTACPQGVTASQDTRTALWPRRDTPTLSTPPSATASHHRFVSTCVIRNNHRNTQSDEFLQTCACTRTGMNSASSKHTHLSAHIHYHTRKQDSRSSSRRL